MHILEASERLQQGSAPSKAAFTRKSPKDRLRKFRISWLNTTATDIVTEVAGSNNVGEL